MERTRSQSIGPRSIRTITSRQRSTTAKSSRNTVRHRLRVPKRLTLMADSESFRACRRRLGTNGPELLGLGLGCFGLSDAYGQAEESESIRTIHRAWI